MENTCTSATQTTDATVVECVFFSCLLVENMIFKSFLFLLTRTRSQQTQENLLN